MVEKILVATDGSTHAEKAVDLAAGIAASTGAEIHVVHVMMHGNPPDELQRMAEVEHMVKEVQHIQPALDNIPGGVAGVIRWAHENAKAAQVMSVLGDRILADAQHAAERAGVKTVTTEVVNGNPAGAIVEAARRSGSDMIVMGSRGLGDLKGLMVGSVSHKVSNMAPCTCVTVK